MNRIDVLKSYCNSWSEEDQMEEMMMTMMQFPEFPGGYSNDVVPDQQFPAPPAQFMDATTMGASPSWSSFSNLQSNSATICFTNNSPGEEGPISISGYGGASSSEKGISMAAMREMIFRIAAMQPIHIDPESVKPPKRRNVKISKDPQSVAARHRRERISERIRILQRLVPGGTKMDTASMLDEAIHYVKFLKSQVQSLERAALTTTTATPPHGMGFPVAMSTATNTTALPISYQSLPNSHPPASQHQLHRYGDASRNVN